MSNEYMTNSSLSTDYVKEALTELQWEVTEQSECASLSTIETYLNLIGPATTLLG